MYSFEWTTLTFSYSSSLDGEVSDREGICVFPGLPVDQEIPGHPAGHHLPECSVTIFVPCFLDTILGVSSHLEVVHAS